MSQEPKPLPPDCVGFVHTESLAALIQNANTFIGAIVPGMNAQLLTLHLGTYLKNPMLLGVDQNRPLSVVFLNPNTYPKWYVLLVSVVDGPQFLSGMGQLAKDAGEADGIRTMVASDFDTAAFQKATPEQRQNFEQFRVQKNYYVAVVDKTAIFSENQSACATVKNWLAQGLLDASKSATVKGDVVAVVNVKGLMEIYGAEIDQKIAPLMTTLEQSIQMAQSAGPPATLNPAALAKILKLEIDAVLALAKQIDTLEFGLDLRPEGIRGRAMLVTRPDTATVRFIAAQKAFQPDLARFIPADASVVGEYDLTITPELMDFYISFVDALCSMGVQPPVSAAPTPPQKPIDPTQKEHALKILRDAVNLNLGRVAFGVVVSGEGQSGYTILTVSKDKDAVRDKKLMVDLLGPQGPAQMICEAMDLKMTFKHTDNVETFEGVAVSEIEFAMPTDAQEAIEQIKKLYGYPLRLRYAFVNDKMLTAFGKNADDRLHQIISLAKAGGGDILASADMKTLLATLPPGVNFFIALKPGQMLEGIRPAAPPAGEPGAPAFPIPVTGALGAYATMSGRTISGELFVPMDLVLSIKDAIFSGIMGGGMQPPRPRPGAPAPAAPAPKPAPQAQ